MWALDYHPEGFSWIDANDASGNVLSFLRHAVGTDPASTSQPGAAAGASVLACIVNFSGRPHLSYRVGLPMPGRWGEVLNTDAFSYGGSGVGNLGAIEAVDEPWHGQPASAVVTLPPLGVLWLTPQDAPASPAEDDAPASAAEDEAAASLAEDDALASLAEDEAAEPGLAEDEAAEPGLAEDEAAEPGLAEDGAAEPGPALGGVEVSEQAESGE
jgi:1,4-alpha-glucan branching enzyme